MSEEYNRDRTKQKQRSLQMTGRTDYVRKKCKEIRRGKLHR